MLCTYRRRNGEEKLAVACVKVQWSFEDEEGLMGAVQGELAALVTGDDGILDVRVGRVGLSRSRARIPRNMVKPGKS